MEYSIDGINKINNILFKNINYRKLDSNHNLNYSNIYIKLYYYTKYRDKTYIPSNIKELINNIKCEDSINYYNDDNVNFEFLLLSDFDYMKMRKKELTSDKRLHKCHITSYYFILNFPYENIYLLTGFINISNHDILHSVVEIKDKNNESSSIIDYTQNLIMKKDDYDKITNFKYYSKISKQDLINDKDIIISFNMKLPIFLFFRDEIMKDLQKNEKVLKLNN